MYKVNDIVVYRRNVCRVTGTTTSSFNGEECYLLEPYFPGDAQTKMVVPVANKGGHLRPVASRKQIEKLFAELKDLDTLENKSANMKSQYAALLKGDDLADLFCILKTSYLRNKKRAENHRKLASIDDEYFAKAEGYLLNECAVAMNMNREETKAYVEEAFRKSMSGKKA